ncbi:MAG: hypothetical protein PVF43_15880 [Candidatus Eiseniibacteriota bacterium]|jgi:hypothetical protein
MASLKMVRCTVRRGADGVPSRRFIPLDTFDLWLYLMKHRHGFRVLERRTSIWMDLEDSIEVDQLSGQLERVDEVCLHVFSEKDSMFRRICRYFPVAERDRLTRVLLGHYRSTVYEDERHPQIQERSGVWVVRHA